LKAILHWFVLAIFLLIIVSVKTYAATYDWVGTSLTGGVYNWNDKLNWQVGGVAATTIPGASDMVRIAVNAYTNNPTITDSQSCASLILGVYDNFTLTVNGTLTVSGDIIQNNDPNFYQYTTLAGTGTITCTNLKLGDNTQPGSGMGVVINVSSQVNQLTINGNLILNSVGNSAGNGIEYPYFSLDANKLSLYGQIYTTTYSNPLSQGVGDPVYPGLGLFQMDSFATATTLELLNANPIVTSITTGFTVDFTNNGSGAGTVIYDAPSGTQTVYTAGTTGVGINNYNYDYLTFGGASTKLVIGGALTVGNDWTTGGTGTVNLSTNNPAITVSGNWANSTNVTQGSGNITITNTLQNNSNTITAGSGTLSVGNALQINGGTVSAGSGTVTVSGIFQNNSGTLNCGSGSVVFKGDYTNSGTFTAGSGTVYFSGTSQNLLDNGSTGTTFNNVTFNCSGIATMGAGVGNFSVSGSGVLTLISPAKIVAGTSSAAYLTLKSDATGSATIAAISGTSTITGEVNVQRYITGGSSTYRGYRLLSSTVYNATAGSNNIYNFDYILSSVLLSGAAGGGFDKTGNPSLYLYRENQAYSNVAFTLGNFSEVSKINNIPTYNLYVDGGSTNYNISAGNGFLLFFRGDRTTNLINKYTPGTIAESVTLTDKGLLNQGQIIVKDWYTPASSNLGYTTTAGNTVIRGYNLVGNPYPSSINWDLYNTSSSTTGIYASNVGTSIYVFDPVSRNYGVYIKGAGAGTHNTSAILPSGQGFFVVASNASAQLIFNESAKVNTQVTGPNLLLGMPVDYTNIQYFKLQLAKDSINTDDIVIHFTRDASTAYSPTEDAPYKQGMGSVSLASISSNNVDLAINALPLPKTSETIGLSVKATATGTYRLNMNNIVGIPQLFDIWLMDAYKKDSLNMRLNTAYSFQILKSDTNSFGSKRFSLVIRQNPAYAYQLLDFTAAKVTPAQVAIGAKQVQLTWKTKNEQNYTTFTVERSTDNGQAFEVLGGIPSSAQGTYTFPDKNPATGQNLYRLKQNDINDNVTYSKVVQVLYSDPNNNLGKGSINVYPNPANNIINLTISPSYDVTGTNYNIRVTNSTGMVVKEVTSAQPQWQSSVSNLLIGTYFIEVVNNKDKSLIGKTKFVKL
jgi:hypothetical protein